MHRRPNTTHTPARSPGRWLALIGLLAAALCGCASPPGIVFTPGAGKQSWPSPPEEPRISYLGALQSADELKPELSGLEAVGAFLFGREPTPGMVSPMGVCTNGERVFVADSGAHVLHVFDLDSQRYASWSPPEGQPGLQRPVATVFDTDRNRVLLADAEAGVIWTFSADGKLGPVLGKGKLGRPCGLAIQPKTGNIYVTDVSDHSVVVMNPDGTEIVRLGSRGSGNAQFNYPTFIVFDSKGNLYVADSLNFRIQVFDPSGRFVRAFGKKGDLPGYFSQPKGVAIDPDDQLYVVDANFEAFQIFTPEGALLMAVGHEGRGPGEFWLPVGVWIDPKGRIWIADTYNRRIQVFQYLRAGGKP